MTITYPGSLGFAQQKIKHGRFSHPQQTLGFLTSFRAQDCEKISVTELSARNSSKCYEIHILGMPCPHQVSAWESYDFSTDTTPIVALAAASHAKVRYHGEGLAITYAHGIRQSVEMIPHRPGEITAYVTFEEAFTQ